MLCRTANELFWMSRHIERAENMARMLDVTYRMSLLPYDMVEPGLAWAEPWAVPLVTSGLATEYYEQFTELSAQNVLKFLILDASNPSSDVYKRQAGEGVSPAAWRDDATCEGPTKKEGVTLARNPLGSFGGRYWVRTSDPCRVKAVLYH